MGPRFFSSKRSSRISLWFDMLKGDEIKKKKGLLNQEPIHPCCDMPKADSSVGPGEETMGLRDVF